MLSDHSNKNIWKFTHIENSINTDKNASKNSIGQRKIKEKINKCFELNRNKNTTYQNSRETVRKQ